MQASSFRNVWKASQAEAQPRPFIFGRHLKGNPNRTITVNPEHTGRIKGSPGLQRFQQSGCSQVGANVAIACSASAGHVPER